MQFNNYMMENYFAINCIVALLAGWIVIVLDKRLPKGWIASVVGLLPAIILAIIVAMIVSGAFEILFFGVRVVQVMMDDPGGAVAFFLETGIEFGLLGIVIALVLYVVARFRGRNGAAAAMTRPP